ncbi:MAG TPA: hypothetical protein VFH51_10725, partial [Myxococcota bacterium]|nr:hypothetical protein [Myxococcota bacterium]
SPREALTSALENFDVELIPARYPHPAPRHELNFRGDHVGSSGASIPAALPHVAGQAHLQLGLKPTTLHYISIPGSGDAQARIFDGTRADIAIDVDNGLPAAVVSFSRALDIRNPLELAGFRYLNKLARYALRHIYINRDGSVEIEGTLRLAHAFTKHDRRKVREPVTSVREHSLVELCVAAGTRALRSVPTALERSFSFLFGDTADKPVGDYESMLNSLAPLALPGSFEWRGQLFAQKPLLARFDNVDILLGPQVCDTTLKADMQLGREGAHLTLHPGSKLRSDAAEIDLAGELWVNQRGMEGRRVSATVRHLHVDVAITRGPDETLCPLVISSRAPDAQAVAKIEGDFSMQDKLRLDGTAAFNFPLTLGSATPVRARAPQGNIELRQCDLSASGAVRIGRLVTDPSHSIEAEALVSASNLSASLVVNPLRVQELQLPEKTHIAAVHTGPTHCVNLRLDCVVLPERGYYVKGKGRMSIPARLTGEQPAHLLVAGNGIEASSAQAKLKWDPLRFTWTRKGFTMAGKAVIDYVTQLRGHMLVLDRPRP